MTSAMTSDRYPVIPGVPSRYGYTCAEARNAVVVIRMKQRAERVRSMGPPRLWPPLTVFASFYPATYSPNLLAVSALADFSQHESLCWWRKDVTSQRL